MKPITKNSSFIFIFFMLAITCAKEKEESTTDTNQETYEETKAANKAVSEWKKFNKTAESLLAITATNLKSLSAVREKTLIVDEQQSLFLIYTQSKNQYNELKSRLANKNSTFKKDIINYKPETETKYRVFTTQFLREIVDLNNNLEDLVEEIKTGPMHQ
jgi:transcriptional/translational regulatory protein YebC/TACO1